MDTTTYTDSVRKLAGELNEMKKKVNDICAEMEAKVKAHGDGNGIISFFGKGDHEDQSEYIDVLVALNQD